MSANPHDRPSDGGPGFPMEIAGWEGMSLRDYFAGQALIGLLSNPGKIADPAGNILQRNPPTMAGMAYEIADAMLKAREL